MDNSQQKSWGQVERNTWLQLLATFVLILALAGTVYVLYARLTRDLDGAAHVIESSYYPSVGLVGLVFVFILHAIFKQIELSSLRNTLKTEESELTNLRTRLTEITNLFEVATTLNLRLPVDSILNILVRRVVDAIKAQQASVMLYQSETETLETKAFYGVEGEFTSSGKLRLGEGIAGKVAEKREAVLLGQEPADAGLKKYYKPHRNITSALSVPLVVDNRCVGVLNINRINHPVPFNEKQREILRLFAEHIGAVVERATELDRIADRSQELELANTKLVELNKMKEAFLSTASHELKTPLTSVIGYAEILNQHDAILKTEQRREFVHRLHVEAQHLLNLIEDILDLTRLETGKIELNRSTLSLTHLAQTAAETSRPLAKKRNVVIVEEYDDSVESVWLDEVKIRQALVNLIVNAIKYSPEGGEVKVQTRAIESAVLVEVSDAGPGVPTGTDSQIFALFGQGLRPSTKSTSGLGIGLHLVKRIVELHGGDVGVDSNPDQGSTFWIRIPEQEASSKAA